LELIHYNPLTCFQVLTVVVVSVFLSTLGVGVPSVGDVVLVNCMGVVAGLDLSSKVPKTARATVIAIKITSRSIPPSDFCIDAFDIMYTED